MTKPSTRLLAAAALVAVVMTAAVRVECTVAVKCKAAAASDRRVNYQFCVSQLGMHHDSPDADMWGLAKIAALVGVNNAYLAMDDIKNLQAKPSTDAKTKAVLGQSLKLYTNVAFAFASAHDELNARDYAEGKRKLGQAISLTQQCEGSIAKAGVRSPLAQRSADSVSLAIISTAITNLIK